MKYDIIEIETMRSTALFFLVVGLLVLGAGIWLDKATGPHYGGLDCPPGERCVLLPLETFPPFPFTVFAKWVPWLCVILWISSLLLFIKARYKASFVLSLLVFLVMGVRLSFTWSGVLFGLQ